MPRNHPVRMTDAQADWLAEDMAGAAQVPQPTKAEDAALSLELARENAEGAQEEMAEMTYNEEEQEPMSSAQQMIDDDTGETVTVPPEEVFPMALVNGEFVELDAGVWVRAAAVQTVLEMAPFRDAPGASNPKTYLCNVVTSGDAGARGNWSIYPARTVLAALNMALEEGRARRVERADY